MSSRQRDGSSGSSGSGSGSSGSGSGSSGSGSGSGSGRLRLARLAVVVLLGCHVPALAPAPAGPPPRAHLHTAAGETVLQLEVAADAASRSRGLMGRRALAADAAMVFVFPDDAPRDFWMRNTPLSLDLLCIEALSGAQAGGQAPAQGVVSAVLPHARPYDETPLHCRSPSRWVLEMAAGGADRLDIQAGCRVTWEHLPAAAEAAR